MIKDVLKDDFEYILSQKLPWEKLNNKTVLISGANGFIASYLIKFLLYLNDVKKSRMKIIGISRSKEKAIEKFSEFLNRPDLKFIIRDITAPVKLKEKIHFIIHAASQASPKYYSTDPVGTLKANVLGTYNLLELAREDPVESFLFISAGEIYGIINQNGKTDEKTFGSLDPAEVRSCYAESKRFGETMCASYHHQFHVPAKIVRLYHTYGPGVRLDDGRVFADFVANILNNQNIVLKSDGSAIRSFCYLSDTITGFLTVLLEGKNGQAYNLANENATVSIKELAEKLIKLFPEKKLKVVFGKRPKDDKYAESKIAINNPDTQKIRSLGWQPHFSLEEGFSRTIKSYLNGDSN